MESYLADVVVARLSQPDARQLVHRSGADVAALRTEAVGLRERLDALAVDFADGSLTASQLRTATERLRTRLGDVEAELADSARVDVFGDMIGAKDVRAAWDALSVDRQRLIVDALMEVTLHAPGRGTRTFRPETVDITWRS